MRRLFLGYARFFDICALLTLHFASSSFQRCATSNSLAWPFAIPPQYHFINRLIPPGRPQRRIVSKFILLRGDSERALTLARHIHSLQCWRHAMPYIKQLHFEASSFHKHFMRQMQAGLSCILLRRQPLWSWWCASYVFLIWACSRAYICRHFYSSFAHFCALSHARAAFFSSTSGAAHYIAATARRWPALPPVHARPSALFSTFGADEHMLRQFLDFHHS